ncbi:VWA domain-containing protein [Paenibacillus sp. J2TS4]|uniref:vWA domain-containing protein n=1 Tax=Paenibacillus sp. J2TS4 TaxID=2807194 RepID=UPI001B0829E0|nr:VWA domain-containing protein [Paenibacillus sp. J2TS4]GIP36679.1 hypothetical protein J2TS4_58890 [Paenibacillus sp. J2TS4]
MFFESIASLWFALSLPAIIVMYLFKRKYIDTPISSHMLWNRILKDIEANRPWQKLRNRLLMLIQLLAAALLVLALMKPFIWAEQAVRDHVVLVVDNSASMQALMQTNDGESERTRLQEGKERVLHWAKTEAKGSRFTLISIGAVPEVLLSGDSSLAVLADALEQIQPFYGQAGYEEAMSLAAALTREDPDSEIRIITDGQWPETASAVRVDVPFNVDRVADSETDNIQIVQFGVREDGPGLPTVTGVATIKNWGAKESAFDLSVYADDQMAEARELRLAAGEQRTVYFQALSSADVYRLEAEVDDLLQADNTAYAFVAGGRSLTAVLVSDGNLFLEKALSLAGVDFVKVQRGESAFAIPQSGFDIVIVDAVEEAAISTVEWQELLADKPVWYIHTGLDGTDTLVQTADYSVIQHPVTQYIALQDVHVASARYGEAPAWAKPLITAGQLPLVYAGEEDGKERLLFTFDLHASDLPLRSEFPILVQNAVEWLGKSRVSNLGLAVASEMKEIPISIKTTRALWVSADGGKEWEAESREGRVASIQTVPPAPGLYRFVEFDSNGEEIQSRWLASVMDSRESNLTLQHELTFAGGSGPASDGAGSGAAQETAVKQAEGKSPRPITTWLIAAILLVVLLEWGVYQRGNSV